LIKQNSSNALLLESYADLPTVTMQRVKAMMIGDIPQFVEISNNFDA
jgi:predicted AlkP superfamily pyrophosphatase or phosphodiesterase